MKEVNGYCSIAETTPCLQLQNIFINDKYINLLLLICSTFDIIVTIYLLIYLAKHLINEVYGCCTAVVSLRQQPVYIGQLYVDC